MSGGAVVVVEEVVPAEVVVLEEVVGAAQTLECMFHEHGSAHAICVAQAEHCDAEGLHEDGVVVVLEEVVVDGVAPASFESMLGPFVFIAFAA